MGDTQLTLAVLQMALGAFAALMALLAYVRGVAGSKYGEPYRREKQPGAFWTRIGSVSIIAAYLLINGAIDLFRFIESSN